MSQTQNVAQLKHSVLFEKSPIPVILSKMPDARVVETNDAFLSLYEFSRSEVLGKTSLELGIDSLVDHNEVRSRLSQFGYLKDYECVRHSKTGRQLNILLNVNFIDIAGEEHALTTIVDQTRQKKIEEDLRVAQLQASEASRLKSEFLAGMSHEICTPLSIVLGFSEMITKSVHSLEQAQKYAGRILQSSKHLKSLIDDVLDLSKIEAGKVHLDKTTFSFERMLDDELALLKSFAEQKGLYFKVNKFRLPSRLSTDATRFRQILNNVIGNAIKYTESGGVTIDVDLETHLEIAVHDTGIGISEASKDKVFKTFERGDKSTLRRFGGTGLGLVLAKKLAQALGGDVILRQSQEQQGSTFVITIDPGANLKDKYPPATH